MIVRRGRLCLARSTKHHTAWSHATRAVTE
nr:MAG TPA: hypothetical protein [Caudoviricetes sp.]